MPAFCSHYLLCKELEGWAKDFASFEYRHNCACIGTQGPDLFFFQRSLPIIMPGKGRSKVGNEIHHAKPEIIFDALAQYLRENNNPIVHSYIYGFLMHYALDRICHPYVYALQDEMTKDNDHLHPGAAHNIIEMALDDYMLHVKCGIDNSKDFDASANLHHTEEEEIEIAKTIVKIVSSSTQQTVTLQEARYCMKDTITSQKILRDKTSSLTRFAKIVDVVAGPMIGYFLPSSIIRPKDWKKGLGYANIEHRDWYSPYESEIARQESFEDLFDKAVADAKELIAGFERLVDGEITARELTHNISFLTGTEVTN